MNASDFVHKEFEIYYVPSVSATLLLAQQQQQQQQQQLFLYVGHQERKSEVNHFHYDIGQIILSKDANYGIEHLVLLMQIMDTNVSHLEDRLDKYEWDFVNGAWCDVAALQNLTSLTLLNECCDHIRSQLIGVYHPKYPHVGAIRSSLLTSPSSSSSSSSSSSTQAPLIYVDISSSSVFKALQESRIDTVLARTGGIRHLLMAIGKLMEDECKSFSSSNVDIKIERKHQQQQQQQEEKQLTSLVLLETMLCLLAKRPNVQFEFKQLDGYALLKHVFICIANMRSVLNTSSNNNTNTNNGRLRNVSSTSNMSSSTLTSTADMIGNNNNNNCYFDSIRTRLFVVLVNACFRKPMFVCSRLASVAGGGEYVIQDWVDTNGSYWHQMFAKKRKSIHFKIKKKINFLVFS